MTKRVRGLVWKAAGLARDLHVLPGHVTRPLAPDLNVQSANTANPAGVDDVEDLAAFLAANPAVGFEFRPLFNANKVGDVWVGSGLGVDVSVHAKTGVVTIGPTLPALPAVAKRNFIVEARLTEDRLVREVIRVQVHQSVKDVWLTPSTLTVRLGGTVAPTMGPRFTVRAEFDDGVVGDVTLNHGVTWSGDKPGRPTAEGFLRVDAGTDTPGDTIAITATLPARLGGKSTPAATLKVAPSWASTAPMATSMTGGASAAVREPAVTPNVLFVSDGFLPAQRSIFEALTDLLVEQLRTSPVTRPYDLLAASINFWRVFLPADQSGLSVREEVFEPPGSGGAFVRPMPPALPPVAGPWTKVEYLIYTVGLPMSSDAGKAPGNLRAEWGGLIAPEHVPIVNDATIVPDALIAEWQGCATRGMVDEIDGFPGMAMGAPPAARIRASALLEPHPDRGGPAEYVNFLHQLSGPVIVPGAAKLGDLWAADPPVPVRFESQELVVILSSYPGGRPLNSHPPIALGTDSQRDAFPATKVATRRAYTLLPFVVPGMAPHLGRVVAHEMAHSFGIGDEYREFKEPDPELDPRDVDWYSNLQYKSALELGGAGTLSTAKIKWNWHRIRKAAVVDGPIVADASPGRFKVPVDPGSGTAFAKGDPVLLRVRHWNGVIGRETVVLNGLAHEAVVAEPPTANEILIAASPTTFLSLADLAPFTPGSLIYVPVAAPASVFSAATYPYAEMIAKNVRDHMQSTQRPLTAVPCAPEPKGTTFTLPQLDGVTLKPDLCVLCAPQMIVGLYEGGNRYACGVYRPAGECNMGPSDPGEYKLFCPVCRYVIVDAVDPTKHGLLDAFYARGYPL